MECQSVHLTLPSTVVVSQSWKMSLLPWRVMRSPQPGHWQVIQLIPAAQLPWRHPMYWAPAIPWQTHSRPQLIPSWPQLKVSAVIEDVWRCNLKPHAMSIVMQWVCNSDRLIRSKCGPACSDHLFMMASINKDSILFPCALSFYDVNAWGLTKIETFVCCYLSFQCMSGHAFMDSKWWDYIG